MQSTFYMRQTVHGEIIGSQTLTLFPHTKSVFDDCWCWVFISINVFYTVHTVSQIYLSTVFVGCSNFLLQQVFLGWLHFLSHKFSCSWKVYLYPTWHRTMLELLNLNVILQLLNFNNIRQMLKISCGLKLNKKQH